MFAPTRNSPGPSTPRLAARSAQPEPQAISGQALSQRSGRGHRVELPGGDPGAAVLSGNFSIAQLRGGLYMHCTDIDHLQPLTTHFALTEPSIKVLLRLEGSAQVKLGGKAVDLEAGQGRYSRARGAVVTLTEAVEFERHCPAGLHERMVAISLSPEWFASAAQEFPAYRQHLAIQPWTPSPRSLAIAEQLIRPPHFDGPMHTLLQESRALELVAEALTQASIGSEQQAKPLPATAYRRIERLRQLLDSGHADEFDMHTIAQHIGCNANTLQQQFRQTYGQTIFEYLREQRLLRAARALQDEGISVARAAEIAGYTNQANFSTAFSRQFGLSPKHFRLKI